MKFSASIVLTSLLVSCSTAFQPVSLKLKPNLLSTANDLKLSHTALQMSSEDDGLQKKFGGYTAKQRLREEVESPFRTVRLFFFGSSTGSALTALYFSALNAARAASGIQYANPPPPLEECLQSCAINVIAAIVCGVLTYRDWKAGEANLARIAKGGQLAKLVVSPMSSEAGSASAVPLAEYRRTARVLIAAGGKEYIETLCRSLNADQLADSNPYAAGLEASDVIVIPILLEGDGLTVGDTKTAWMETKPRDETVDRNFDVKRAAEVIAFPRGPSQWAEYLESEVQTAKKQGFDVINKGFIILVKKNGRILRRATGQPPLNELIGTMEVLDGSKFGMPGDDEKYGSKN